MSLGMSLMYHLGAFLCRLYCRLWALVQHAHHSGRGAAVQLVIGVAGHAPEFNVNKTCAAPSRVIGVQPKSSMACIDDGYRAREHLAAELMCRDGRGRQTWLKADPLRLLLQTEAFSR